MTSLRVDRSRRPSASAGKSTSSIRMCSSLYEGIPAKGKGRKERLPASGYHRRPSTPPLPFVYHVHPSEDPNDDLILIRGQQHHRGATSSPTEPMVREWMSGKPCQPLPYPNRI